MKENMTEELTEELTEEKVPAVTLPENPLFEVDVHMDTAALYDYMLRHTYTSPFGLVATALGCMSLLFFL